MLLIFTYVMLLQRRIIQITIFEITVAIAAPSKPILGIKIIFNIRFTAAPIKVVIPTVLLSPTAQKTEDKKIPIAPANAAIISGRV